MSFIYQFIGDRSLLYEAGYALYRKNGLSYTKPNFYSHGAIYLIAAGGMTVYLSTFASRTSQIIDFILENKDKPRSFWIDDDKIDDEYSFCNYVIHSSGKIMDRKELSRVNIASFKEKHNRDFYPPDILDMVSDNHIDVRFLQCVIDEVLELHSLSPLKKVVY